MGVISEYKAQLLAVDAKLANDPDNEELLSLKEDLNELIELSQDMEEEEQLEKEKEEINKANAAQSRLSQTTTANSTYGTTSYSGGYQSSSTGDQDTKLKTDNNLVNGNANSSGFRRPLTEAELLIRKKEKNKKKKAKLREKVKQQLDIAESEKNSWQSFANKKGLKGITKKSIFASPCSLTGKVGVGTNGIADAPTSTGIPSSSTSSSTVFASIRKKY